MRFPPHQPAAGAKNIKFDLVVRPDVRSCRTDQHRVEQILVNLLNNAVRHSSTGSSIGVEVAPRGEFVAFTVSDSGPGIPEGDLEGIFDVYFTKADEESRGAGLGLPLSRRLAQLLRGSLWAGNRTGGGAQFVLEIPAIPAA